MVMILRALKTVIGPGMVVPREVSDGWPETASEPDGRADQRAAQDRGDAGGHCRSSRARPMGQCATGCRQGGIPGEP